MSVRVSYRRDECRLKSCLFCFTQKKGKKYVTVFKVWVACETGRKGEQKLCLETNSLNFLMYFRIHSLQLHKKLLSFKWLWRKIYTTISTFALFVPSHSPAVVSQNSADKSFLVCVKSEKYAFWVILRPIGSMRRGKAEGTLHYILGKVKPWLI